MTVYQDFRGLEKTELRSQLEYELEQLARTGYFLVENVFSDSELSAIRGKIDAIWAHQVAKYGEEHLKAIGDWGIVREMMGADPYFFDLIVRPEILERVAATVGETAILHLQNGIVLHPGQQHNQARFHKDFPKDFLSTKILSFNAFIVVDDFTEKTGGTWLVPGSHKSADMPSLRYMDEKKVQLIAKAGSILFFDSTLWHKSGSNLSEHPRRAINQQYTRPFIKQQLDYPAVLKGKVDMESKLAQTLGLWALPPKGVDEYRVTDPRLRTYRAGQG
jgi:ectoine hydroxylase-related dioxygenase (phytanoyl-CoA dioxygenase family)